MTDKASNWLEIRVGRPAETDFYRLGEHAFIGESNFDDVDLIERVRDRLDIESGISDVTIAASLAQIAAQPDLRGRWLAAFGSPLGKHLAQRGSDLNTTLNVLMALAPRQPI